MPAKTQRKKKSYGGCTIDHFSPASTPDWPKGINIVLSFEEAMKLSLSLQHRLLDINSLNRSTREGKAAAVNVCVYTDKGRITVNADKLKLR
ncbi:hypothetical protein LCGC14_0983140 [marine sediment metagenome]|uniref:Uncharacterized protein n=1 Tax=marine sediment metagenome TaxID=412755 RepID=A0A0F9NCM3_9ZZZZ